MAVLLRRFPPCCVALFLGLAIASPAFANSKEHPHRFDPAMIRLCVNQLLYENVFPNGDPIGDRTIIDPSSAAIACRGVQSSDDALEAKRCMNGLLYENTFRDGKPVGDRTVLDPVSAAQACQRCSLD